MKDKTLVESVKAILKLPILHFTEHGIVKINEPFTALAANFIGNGRQYGVFLFKRHVNITIWWCNGNYDVKRRSPLMQIPLTEKESEELQKLFNEALERFKQECLFELKLPLLSTPSTIVDFSSEEDNSDSKQ